MKPLVVLLISFALSALSFRLITGDWYWVFSGNLAMGLMLWFTALGHFLFTKGMTMMLPSFVPLKRFTVYATGVLEMVLGAGLVYQPTRYDSGIALLIFLLILLPANIYAALRRVDHEKGTFEGKGPKYLWFRVPLQLLFFFWIWYFTIR